MYTAPTIPGSDARPCRSCGATAPHCHLRHLIDVTGILRTLQSLTEDDMSVYGEYGKGMMRGCELVSEWIVLDHINQGLKP